MKHAFIKQFKTDTFTIDYVRGHHTDTAYHSSTTFLQSSGSSSIFHKRNRCLHSYWKQK